MNSTYIMQRTHVRIHYVNSFTIDFTKKINEPCQEIHSHSSEMKQKKPLNNLSSAAISHFSTRLQNYFAVSAAAVSTAAVSAVST